MEKMKIWKAAVYQEVPFDYLIHCGDVEGREIFIEALAECPCCIVAGNNDFFSDLPREDVVEIEGHRIFVTHGHLYGVSMTTEGVADAAAARDCQAVIFRSYPLSGRGSGQRDPDSESGKPDLPTAAGTQTKLCGYGSRSRKRFAG